MLEVEYLNKKYDVENGVNGFQLVKILDEKIRFRLACGFG